MSEAHVSLLAEHARRQLARGDVQGAIESLRRALSLEPDEAGLHALLSAALLGARRRHAARHEAERAIGLDPDHPGAHRMLGYVRLAFRDHRAAAEAFERALELSPDEPETHLGIARMHAAAGRRPAARAALERALLLDPGDPDVLAELGALDLADGRKDAARARALEALQEFPEHEEAIELLGRVLLAEGRTEEARAHALDILRQDATSPGGVGLLCAVKARQSLLLGLWWRWNAFMSKLADGKAVLVLVGLYVAQRFATTGLRDADLSRAAEWVSWAWIAFAVYTWVGPAVFQRSVAKELSSVRLRPDF